MKKNKEYRVLVPGTPCSPLVSRALAFAVERHAGQRRKGDGKPFIVHPIAVGRILAKEGMPDEVVAAGILHDVLEDTPTTAQELARRFGPRVAGMVEEVTEPDRRHSWEQRKRAYLRHLNKASRGALAISCADKLHNTASLLAAYRREGPIVFGRFSRGMDQKLDYHQKVYRAVRRSWPNAPFVDRLQRAVQRMEEVVRHQMRGEPKEVEAKFLARDPAVFRKIARLRSLGRFRRKSSRLERQENLYLDTKDLRLRQARAILKTRRVGSKMEMTFKRELSHRGGVSERIEVTGPAAILRAGKIVGARPLREILNLRTRRRRLIFVSGREEIELDLDRVTVLRNGKEIARHWEVELENRAAKQEHFQAALAELKRSFPVELRASRLPKVEIGLRVLKKFKRRLGRRRPVSGRGG